MKNILAILSLLASPIVADQPIKCPKSGGDVNYIGQVWTFHSSSHSDSVNLYDTKEVCGHQLPNKV